jgi:purine-nucleoside phosphorylase
MSAVATELHPLIDKMRKEVAQSADFIRSKTTIKPEVAIILGSGLGAIADNLQNATSIHYGDIPHFPTSTAPGHKGRLVLGQMGGKNVMVMQGRFHTYEGYTQQQVAYPIRVMKEMGVETLIVTCATGGLNFKFKAGDIMLLVDHLNLTGTNPLIGPNDPLIGERFPVMFDCYTPSLREVAHQVAAKQDVRLQEGVYCGITGPAYFTRSELRYLIKIGGDSIGMSTVGEVITATHAGMKVLGLGTISDMAIPDNPHHATEEEILTVAAAVGPKLTNLITGILEKI